MKRYKIVCLLVVLGVTFSVTSLNAGGLKQKIADSYYKNLAYAKAVKYYVDLAESKKANAEIVRKTADCFNKIGDTANAIKWYEVLSERDWAATVDLYQYFLVLRKAGQYEKSLKVMNDYLGRGGVATDFITYLERNPNYMDELKKKNSDKYTVWKVPFNSEEHDFSPMYYEEGLLFASPEKRKNPGTIRKFAWDNTNFLQLYYVKKEGGNEFSKPKAFSFAKRDKYHDGPIAFNSDYTEAYLTRSNYSAKGKLGKSQEGIVEVNLYMSKRGENGKWSNLEPFAYNSKEYSTGCATLSKDGNIMVFASDMPGTIGETDLWISRRGDNGEWGTPRHLGEKINTARRDNYPYLDEDGNLYFSSDGGIHGLGGYDVYWVPNFLKGGEAVYNVGVPINSEADDFGYIYDPKTATGYFNSGRNGVLGEKGCDDIFGFEKLVSMLEVQVIDQDTREPIMGALGCLQSAYSDPLKSDLPTDDDAKFRLELTPKTYIACASAAGYEPNQTQVVLERGKFKTAIVELKKIVVKEPTPEQTVPLIVPGEPCPEIVLEDIYYDFDKWNIRADATASLDELATFLFEYPTVRIKLKSYTDCRGTHAYNERLSQRRAKSALEYLVRRGVSRDRIQSFGFGETNPVNNCTDGVKCSEREHQANRRTVVELITDDCIEIKHAGNPYLDGGYNSSEYDYNSESDSNSEYEYDSGY